jgi:TonB family protein
MAQRELGQKPTFRVGANKIVAMRAALTTLAVLLFALPLSGQSSSTLAMPILQGAALPMYPPIAKAAHITGQVIVRVTVKNGQVAKTDILSKPDVASGQRYLETPTVENLKTWRFAADVTGVFTVTYTYSISGTETEEPTNPKIVMLPSLNMEITARPLKPTVSY